MAASPSGGGGEQRDRPPADGVAPELAGQQLTLALLARGQDIPQIAKTTGLSVREVRLHLQEALIKYGATNATNAVALAIAAGDLPPDIALQE